MYIGLYSTLYRKCVFLGIKPLTSIWVQIEILTKFFCFFFLFSAYCKETLKKHSSNSAWSTLLPSSGQNIQQTRQVLSNLNKYCIQQYQENQTIIEGLTTS